MKHYICTKQCLPISTRDSWSYIFPGQLIEKKETVNGHKKYFIDDKKREVLISREDSRNCFEKLSENELSILGPIVEQYKRFYVFATILRTIHCLQVGDETLVAVDKDQLKAAVRYIGPLNGRNGTWFGVELQEHNKGNTDGSFEGQKLFEARPNGGLFVSAEKLLIQVQPPDGDAPYLPYQQLPNNTDGFQIGDMVKWPMDVEERVEVGRISSFASSGGVMKAVINRTGEVIEGVGMIDMDDSLPGNAVVPTGILTRLDEEFCYTRLEYRICTKHLRATTSVHTSCTLSPGHIVRVRPQGAGDRANCSVKGVLYEVSVKKGDLENCTEVLNEIELRVLLPASGNEKRFWIYSTQLKYRKWPKAEDVPDRKGDRVLRAVPPVHVPRAVPPVPVRGAQGGGRKGHGGGGFRFVPQPRHNLFDDLGARYGQDPKRRSVHDFRRGDQPYDQDDEQLAYNPFMRRSLHRMDPAMQRDHPVDPMRLNFMYQRPKQGARDPTEDLQELPFAVVDPKLPADIKNDEPVKMRLPDPPTPPDFEEELPEVALDHLQLVPFEAVEPEIKDLVLTPKELMFNKAEDLYPSLHYVEMGSLVLVTLGGQLHNGLLRWTGLADKKACVGVELLDNVVKGNDGKFGNIRLFECAMGRGILVPENLVKPMKTRIEEPPVRKTSDVKRSVEKKGKKRVDTGYLGFIKSLVLGATRFQDGSVMKIGGSIVVEIAEGSLKYGRISWTGMAGNEGVVGMEMNEEMADGTDGTFSGVHLFKCPPGRGILMPAMKVKRDQRPPSQIRVTRDGLAMPTEAAPAPKIVSLADNYPKTLQVIEGVPVSFKHRRDHTKAWIRWVGKLNEKEFFGVELEKQTDTSQSAAFNDQHHLFECEEGQGVVICADRVTTSLSVKSEDDDSDPLAALVGGEEIFAAAMPVGYALHGVPLGSVVRVKLGRTQHPDHHLGTLHWTGFIDDDYYAGVELEDELAQGSDGTLGVQRLFRCKNRHGVVIMAHHVSQDV